MAQRTVCLCEGKYIGIETIYTVVNGQQINIPEKLKELRIKSQSNQLFCPCGCGAKLTLVAGDRNLREQHFRLKDGTCENKCQVVTEGKTSLDSKIVLKCWLDEKLESDDIETRVPISALDDVDRKYEFTFLSKSKRVAINYCHERVNISNEKLDILEANSRDIKLIHIVDIKNDICNGQYPEALMRVQDRQGYCLLLDVEEASYEDATMQVVFYAQDVDQLWRGLKVLSGELRNYFISSEGELWYQGQLLKKIVDERIVSWEEECRSENERRKEEEKRRIERLQREHEEYEKRRLENIKRQEDVKREWERRQEEIKLRQEQEEERKLTEAKRREDDFRRNIAEEFTQQQTPIRDGAGNRWIKCEYCGRIDKESEFSSYGGANHVNLGTCKKCSSSGAYKVSVIFKQENNEDRQLRKKCDASICPECGGKLREKRGYYGNFIGCENYPTCHYTRKIKK